MKATDPTKSLDWYNTEMEDCATGYTSFIMELLEDAKQICSDPVVLIEQRVDFSRWVEQGFGTSDAILISDGTMHVIDYKHGLGILVSAEDNPQMKCYALGALELFDDIYDIDTVSMTIYQPRRQNISTYEVSKDDLYQWADEVLKPTADLAFAGDGNFLCGEWCGFCKAKHECRARAEANLLLAQHDFKLPPLLEDSEIEVILSRVDELVSWANDIKEYALQQAISGKEWTGWKLVEGRSNRRYTSEDAVSKAVKAAGFDPYEKKLLGITAMQKLLGKGHLYYQYQMQDSDAPTMKNGTVILKPSDVLHVPGLGFDGLVGYSPIAMAKNAIGLAIATEEYGAKFFANGATPGGILEYPGTVKNPEAVRESWTKGFSGNNSHKVAVLEEGMKYTPISISPNEAQFLETRKFQIDEIARIFRVPPHMVGDLEKSSFSNIEQQSLEFVKYTLEPWIVRWEQSINRALLSESEKAAYFVKFNVDGLLRGDYQSRMNGYATARQNGWMSANDIRELENLDLIPPELGGDLYLINGNMTKLEDAGIFAATTAAGKEDENDEEVLEVEKSDDDQSGDAGADTREDTISKRHHRRGKLV